MRKTGIVGKSNSLADIVKTVHREFRSGQDKDWRVPDTRQGVGSLLMQYQSSHRKDDLWHFVTRDYRSVSSIWVQLKSGDNRDMTAIARAVDAAVARLRAEHKGDPAHPVHRLEHKWFGLTYINVIWQEKMVTGMLQAFAGSFLVVFLLMTILFRSALWGLLSMIPLTVTIAAIYGAIGLVGKDYDMPVAVLSSLTLGLAVDFAIHFLARSRSLYAKYGSWKATAPAVFGEPARAITRNIIVIAAGFLPLLLAPLVPYRTVGVLLATILLVSGAATLILLPALIAVLEKPLFKPTKAMGATCNCVTCLATAATAVALVALTLHQSLSLHWTTLTWTSAIAVLVLALGCGVISRRRACRTAPAAEEAPTADHELHE
jgi:predicted RND superfamily exporter protein